MSASMRRADALRRAATAAACLRKRGRVTRARSRRCAHGDLWRASSGIQKKRDRYTHITSIKTALLLNYVEGVSNKLAVLHQMPLYSRNTIFLHLHLNPAPPELLPAFKSWRDKEVFFLKVLRCHGCHGEDALLAPEVSCFHLLLCIVCNGAYISRS